MRFREGLERLEAIVASLEGSALELEDALDAYEDGVKLYTRLLGILAAAEARVEALAGTHGGALRWERFGGPADAGGGSEGDDGGEQ